MGRTWVAPAAWRLAFGLMAGGLHARTQIPIETVKVGYAGNAADPVTGFGAVDYEFQIGRTEVTVAQYAAFLNLKALSDPYGLYSTLMGTWGITRNGSAGSYSYTVTAGWENRPIVYVSWFDAARFANWIHNGQGQGDTETGAYTLNGALFGIVTRNPDARWWIPTEDEWYKAAYYDPVSASYYSYPTSSHDVPAGHSPPGGPNSANYDLHVGTTTDAGAYSQSVSPFGTLDQGGNVWEWNDAVIGASRGMRGSSWADHWSTMHSQYRSNYRPGDEQFDVGFRLAGASVPEPVGWGWMAGLTAATAVWIRRRSWSAPAERSGNGASGPIHNRPSPRPFPLKPVR